MTHFREIYLVDFKGPRHEIRWGGGYRGGRGVHTGHTANPPRQKLTANS